MSFFTNWGSRKEERKQVFTCDRIVRNKNGGYFRAVDVSAPPEIVYKWICQMKAAPYSYDKLDNGGRKSPQQLIPGMDKLKIGEKMMTIFTIGHFIPNQEVTLIMDVPPKPYDRFYVPTAITYRLISKKVGKQLYTRIIVKYVAEWKKTFWGTAEKLFVIVADFIMMRKQLLNFKYLSERSYFIRNGGA